MDDFKPGDQVLYVPTHANGNRGHQDCERGKVIRVTPTIVFVDFGRNSPEGCDRLNLEKGW